MVKQENNKKRVGRPKGAKSKINLPVRNIEEAIDWTRKIYEKVKGSEMSPEDIAKFIEVKRGFGSPAMSVLDKFGLIEKAGFGWKISDLGKKAIGGSKEAVREALSKIDLYRALLTALGDREVTRGVILGYLKKNYRKGENNEVIADKYLEAIKYLDSLSEQIHQGNLKVEGNVNNINNKIISLIKLKYAFHPLDKNSKDELIDEIYGEFNKDENSSVRSIVTQIKENKNNDNVLKVLVDTLLNSFSEKYSLLNISKHSKKEKSKEDSQENHAQS